MFAQHSIRNKILYFILNFNCCVRKLSGNTTMSIREKYKEILRSNGIHDTVAEVNVLESGAKGDGMASLTQCVTVTFENEAKSPLNLFVKLHTGNPSHEKMLADMKAFEKEARYFMQYLPAARQLCESKGLPDLINFYPRCFYGDEQLIVLENLVLEKGYGMMAADNRHVFNTASFVMKTVAKHHAVSYAMIQENGGEDNFFKKFPDLDHESMSGDLIVGITSGFFENALKTANAILEKNKTDNFEETIALLNSFSGTFSEMYSNAVKCPRDVETLLVLNHGDYKNNNMMFLLDKSSKDILHHMAIDLQLINYNSPAFDLVYYLFSSADSKMRQSRYEDLLNVYRNTLNYVSRNLGHPMELTYEDLLVKYRRQMKFGLWMGLAMVGPGMGLVKSSGIDVGKLKMEDLADIFHQCLLKWIDDNPTKGKEMAEEIYGLVDEYNKLHL